VTEGGDADAAFRLARYLQAAYEKFTVIVSGYCKSAGTLVCIGAKEVAFGAFGELGPLDVQMRNNEDWSMSSGLTVDDALNVMQIAAMRCFDQIMSDLSQQRSLLSLKMTTDLASSITTGLFAPIFGQINPMQAGEMARALVIAREYGLRLSKHGDTLQNKHCLEKLVEGYPSHGFVIDILEAKELFSNVRETTSLENLLLEVLDQDGISPNSHGNRLIKFLSKEPDHATDTSGANGALRKVPRTQRNGTTTTSKAGRR
jgi:hypothetical protein